MRIPRAAAVLLLTALAAASSAFAQDGGGGEPAPPPAEEPVAAEPAAEDVWARVQARIAECEVASRTIDEILRRLTARRADLQQDFDDAEAELDTVRAAYEATGHSESLSMDDVVRRIDAIERALAEDERSEVGESLDRERTRATEALGNLRIRGLALSRYWEQATAEARDAVGAEAWAARRDAWAALEKQHRDLVEKLRSDGSAAELMFAECRSLMDRRRAALEQTIDALRAKNLLLRGESRITFDAVSQGLADLGSAPSWAARAARQSYAFLREPRRRREVLTWLTVSGVGMASLLLVRARVRRKLRPPVQLSDDRHRAVDLLLRILTALLMGLALATVPLLAASMLPQLTPGVVRLLRVVAVVIGGAWCIRSAVRRLFPPPGQWTPLRLDPRSTALARTGAQILLWLSVVLVPLVSALRNLGYENYGAFEALVALYEFAVVVVLLIFVLREGVLVGFLPPATARLGRALRRVAGVARPVLLLAGPLIVLLDLLAYDVLADVLARTIGGAVAAIGLGFALYGALGHGLDSWLTTIVEDEGTETRRRDAAIALGRYALRLVVGVGAIALMLLVQGGSFESLRAILDVNLPFQTAGDRTPVTWWNVLAALLIVVLCLRAVTHVKASLECFVLPRTTVDTGLTYTISTLAGYVVAALGIYAGLVQVFDLGALSYALAALSVGIGFGLQEIVSNFVSGLILLFERPLKVGDLVTVGGTEGFVTRINIRATTIQTFDNVSMLIPNKDFITQTVINSVYGDSIVRLRIAVGAAYGSDTDLVRSVLLDVAKAHPRVLRDRAPDVAFLDFGESSLDFELRVWIPEANEQVHVASELRFAIDRAFRENGIEIPFPQRDLHLRSVDEGVALRLRGETPEPSSEPPSGT